VTLPYRGPGPGRPQGLALPPLRMPLWQRGRPLKRWRYVGVYGPGLSLCAGRAQIGPARQAFWAVWDRERGRLHERTAWRRGAVSLEPGRVLVRDGATEIDLVLAEDEGIEVVSPHGRSYIWTRKQGGVPARGWVRVGDERHEVDARAIVDDSAGYHARRTTWRWCAGVGTTRDGAAVAWNLVDGVHDAPQASERVVWVDGVASEVGPVRFEEDLSTVTFAEGGVLRCRAEAVRRRRDNLGLVRSDYRQPFGTFSGTLPGGLDLGTGYGVMEWHDAVW
jgi:hypothetical protein